MRAANEIAHIIPTDPDALLSWPALRALIGMSRPNVWRQRERGEFPAPVRISANRVAWRRRDVIAWIASRPAA